MHEYEKELHETQSVWMPDPGTVPEGHVVLCGVCKCPMTETRNCEGPTSWVMSMSGSKRRHDSYFCPHREEDWHRQVVTLRREASETASRKLHDLLREEAAEVLRTRKATRPVGVLKGL